jgi:hypothetical protein
MIFSTLKKIKNKFKQKFFEGYALLFAKPMLSEVNTFLFDLSLRGLGISDYCGLLLSGEKYLIEVILPCLVKNEEPVMFDGGANQGDYSNQLVQVFPSARIYAFESHPKNFKKLSGMVKKNFSCSMLL